MRTLEFTVFPPCTGLFSAPHQEEVNPVARRVLSYPASDRVNRSSARFCLRPRPQGKATAPTVTRDRDSVSRGDAPCSTITTHRSNFLRHDLETRGTIAREEAGHINRFLAELGADPLQHRR